MSSVSTALAPILQLTTPFDSPETKRTLFERIDRLPGLSDAKVTYYDGVVLTELRPYPVMCMGKYTTVVIRKVQDKNEVTNIQHPQASKKGEDRFYSELMK